MYTVHNNYYKLPSLISPILKTETMKVFSLEEFYYLNVVLFIVNLETVLSTPIYKYTVLYAQPESILTIPIRCGPRNYFREGAAYFIGKISPRKRRRRSCSEGI